MWKINVREKTVRTPNINKNVKKNNNYAGTVTSHGALIAIYYTKFQRMLLKS